MTHERCWLCQFYSGNRCTHTFRLTIMVEPQPGAGIGGQVDFVCTPGMVPQDLVPRLTQYVEKFCEKALPAVSMLPVWDEIRTWQLAHPENQHCPGYQVSELKKSHLKVVPT